LSNLIVSRGASLDSDDDISRVYNGRFESALIGLEGWASTDQELNPITRNTDTPIAGNASLHCAITNDSQFSGALTELIPIAVYMWNQTWRISFKYRGTTALLLYLDYDGVANVSSWTGQATGTTQTATQEVVIPENATGITMLIVTPGSGPSQNGTSYDLDDVKFVKIADAP
jgi:hypothetical protein